jgi:hypothetical protein
LFLIYLRLFFYYLRAHKYDLLILFLSNNKNKTNLQLFLHPHFIKYLSPEFCCILEKLLSLITQMKKKTNNKIYSLIIYSYQIWCIPNKGNKTSMLILLLLNTKWDWKVRLKLKRRWWKKKYCWDIKTKQNPKIILNHYCIVSKYFYQKFHLSKMPLSLSKSDRPSYI